MQGIGECLCRREEQVESMAFKAAVKS